MISFPCGAPLRVPSLHHEEREKANPSCSVPAAGETATRGSLPVGRVQTPGRVIDISQHLEFSRTCPLIQISSEGVEKPPRKSTAFLRENVS
jgi:hypothetical protein